MNLEELMNRVDVILQYAQYADKESIQDFILSLDDEQRDSLSDTLNAMEELLTHSKE